MSRLLAGIDAVLPARGAGRDSPGGYATTLNRRSELIGSILAVRPNLPTLQQPQVPAGLPRWCQFFGPRISVRPRTIRTCEDQLR